MAAGTHVDLESLQEFSRKVYGFAGDLGHSRAYAPGSADSVTGIVGQYGPPVAGKADSVAGPFRSALPEAVDFWRKHLQAVSLLNHFKNQVGCSVQAISAAAGAATSLYDHTDHVSGKQIVNSAFVPQAELGHAPKGSLQHFWDLQQRERVAQD